MSNSRLASRKSTHNDMILMVYRLEIQLNLVCLVGNPWGFDCYIINGPHGRFSINIATMLNDYFRTCCHNNYLIAGAPFSTSSSEDKMIFNLFRPFTFSSESSTGSLIGKI